MAENDINEGSDKVRISDRTERTSKHTADEAVSDSERAERYEQKFTTFSDNDDDQSFKAIQPAADSFGIDFGDGTIETAKGKTAKPHSQEFFEAKAQGAMAGVNEQPRYRPDQLIAANVTPSNPIPSDGITQPEIMQDAGSTDYFIAQTDDYLFIAEAKTDKNKSSLEVKHGPGGDYVTVETEEGILNIPAGDPAFGLPTNFDAYNKQVNKYVKWLESWNGNHYGWNDMSHPQRRDFANALRHALGIGYLVFKGMPPGLAVREALGHETGDESLDSKQDRHNNKWAANTADKMAKEGKTWFDFVAKTTYTAAKAARENNGFLK